MERQTRATELDRKLVRQQNVFGKGKLAQKASIHASYRVAYNIAKHSKPFSDGEFFKKYMLDVTDQVCPERTVARRIKAVGKDLTSQLSLYLHFNCFHWHWMKALTLMIVHSC